MLWKALEGLCSGVAVVLGLGNGLLGVAAFLAPPWWLWRLVGGGGVVRDRQLCIRSENPAAASWSPFTGTIPYQRHMGFYEETHPKLIRQTRNIEEVWSPCPEPLTSLVISFLGGGGLQGQSVTSPAGRSPTDFQGSVEAPHLVLLYRLQNRVGIAHRPT